jgi:ATP-binding cassette, subfamily B, bacterial
MSAAVLTVDLRIRSQIPGRVRWEAPELRDAPALARRVEAALREAPDVQSVEANPTTGRVLVLHEAGASVAALARRVADAIAAGLAAAGLPGSPEPPTAAGAAGEAGEAPNPAKTAAFVLLGSSLLLWGLGAGALALAVGVAGAGAGAVAAVPEVRRRVQARARRRTAAPARERSRGRRFLAELRPVRFALLAAGGLAVLSVVCALGRFYFIGLAMNRVAAAAMAGDAAGASGVLGAVVGFGILSLLTTALQGVFAYWGQLLTQNSAQSIENELRARAYDHAQRVPLAFFDEHERGGIVAVVCEDVSQIEHVFFAGWEGFQLVISGVALTVLFWVMLGPVSASAALLSIPVLVWGSVVLYRRAEPRLRAASAQTGELRARVAESLDGVATIKSFTAEQEALGRVARESDELAAVSRRATAFTASYRPVFELIVMAATVATVIAGAGAVSAGLSIGGFFILIMATRQLLWPLTQFGRIVEMAQGGWSSAGRTFDLLDEPVEVLDQGEPLPKSAVRGEVAAERIRFSHTPRTAALRGVSLRIPAGETVAIVGPTGCGKSTLLKLLLRFYEPSSGRLTIDGEALAGLRLADLRAAIAYVPQEPFFFNGTIRENILFGNPGASEAAFGRAAHVACVVEFLSDQPEGWETRVGERGLRLSGGQRQRLAIARAVLKDAPILVLDEATSHVDNRTQATIHQRLDKARAGKTTVVVAHRLSTIIGADLIYVMRDGRMVQRGTHAELVAQTDGLYARLWSLQLTDDDGDHSLP